MTRVRDRLLKTGGADRTASIPRDRLEHGATNQFPT